jgi:transposase
MSVPVALRTDYDGPALRSLARTSKDGPQTRRLLALAAIYEGASRTEAARISGVGLQTVRDWVLKFNAQGPAGLIDRKPPGQPALLSDAHRRQLSAMIEAGPIPAVHGVVRWRLVDLMQWLWEEYRIAISKQTLSRELRALDYRKLSARPHHYARNEEAARLFTLWNGRASQEGCFRLGRDGSHQSIRPQYGASAPGHHGNPRAPGLLRLKASAGHF